MQFVHEAGRGIDISQIYELAGRVSVLDFQELLRNRREKGFQHFFLDLVKEPETRSPDYNPQLRQGWMLKGGLLVVHENCNSSQLMDFLESKLGHYPWFETRAKKEQRIAQGEQIDPPTLPAGFEAYPQSYKTLGQYGANTAIDVIAFIENPDGTLSLQVIVRPHDKKYAFVGGIIEQKEATLLRCFDETLEEFYSNDLFARNSGTELLAKRLTPVAVTQAFEAVFSQKEFSTLQPVLSDIMTTASSGTDFPRRLESLRRKLLSYAGQPIHQASGKDHVHRVEDLEHLFVRFKCLLYKTMCPEQHSRFVSFLQSHLAVMPLTTNESDPRNTNEAYMVTVPHWLCVSHDEMLSLERDCAIKPKGGDDAVSTNIVPVEKLYEQSMYAAHGRIALEALVDLLSQRPDLLARPVFQEQLRRLEAHVVARESASLGLNAALGIAPMQRSARGKMSLPSVSTAAQVEQLSQVAAASATSSRAAPQTIAMVDTVQTARDFLIQTLGPVRFARIEGKMEDLHIPTSALVAIADAATLEKAVVIIDNSGSTTTNMSFEEDGQPKTASRWDEERNRVRALLPLLAFAGIQVEFRFLNNAPHDFPIVNGQVDALRPRATIAPGSAKSFDFRVRKDVRGQALADDLVALEQEFGRASAFVESVFSGTPSGGTYLEPAITSTLTDIQRDGKRRGFFFLTDGELNDKAKVMQIFRSRANPHLSPILVAACTDKAHEIQWARELQADTSCYVGMLDNHATQARRMEDAHPIVPYERSLWVALHIALPKHATDDLATQGIFLYLKADVLAVTLTQAEVSEMVGYVITDAQYQSYLESRDAAMDGRLSLVAQTAREQQLRAPAYATPVPAFAIGGNNVSVSGSVPPGTAQRLGSYGLIGSPGPTSSSSSAAPDYSGSLFGRK